MRLRKVYRTLLFVDLQLGVEVQSSNDDVAGKVNSADNVEHKRIVKRHALGNLHHTQDDDQVGAIAKSVSFMLPIVPLSAQLRHQELCDELSREEILTSEEREPF